MFELIRHEFVQNAFLAGTIVAIVCGLVGYFVILRGQAFTTESTLPYRLYRGYWRSLSWRQLVNRDALPYLA